jgi:hypothetical protein
MYICAYTDMFTDVMLRAVGSIYIVTVMDFSTRVQLKMGFYYT